MESSTIGKIESLVSTVVGIGRVRAQVAAKTWASPAYTDGKLVVKDGSKLANARNVTLGDGRKVFAGSNDDGGPGGAGK